MSGNELIPGPGKRLPGARPFARRTGVVLAGALALGVGFLAGARLTSRAAEPAAPAASAAPAFPVTSPPSAREVIPPRASFANLAERVAPSVVNITVSKTVRGATFSFPSPFGPNDPFNEFFKQFQIPHGPYRERGLGSGFVISPDGYILTNNHVVDHADEITVKFEDKRELKGKVVGRDPKTDLALVKVKADRPLEALKLGDSSKARVGDWVVAVGNPFGLDHTVTAGIISAKGRALEGPYDDFIQTDASINPGNSGGPLLDLDGKVIGINAQIVAGGQGIGFAIPVNLAKEIIPQLKNKGFVSRGWMGVAIQDLTPEMAKHFDLPKGGGALVADVSSGGPAEKAGMRRGDVIVSYDGKPIHESHDLPILVADTPVGKSVEVKVLRDGKEHTMKLEVGKLKQERVARAGEGEDSGEKLGLAVQDITPEIANSLHLDDSRGALVSQVTPGSPADEAGIHRGDIIREVNQKPVKSAEDFAAKVRDSKSQDSVLLLVERQGQRMYVAVEREEKGSG
jgi:serine protease Do